MNIRIFSLLPVLIIVFINACTPKAGISKTSTIQTKIPVIYCTDLFHPPDDPDDHFDIATLYAIPEIDLKCVILDQGKKQEKKTGQFVLEQLAYLSGKKIPAATGLYSPLSTIEDKGDKEEDKYQGGVALILKTLREAKTPVDFIIVGSTRDVAAAFNRDPELFQKKTRRIHIYSGQASETNPEEEYNVKMDVHGFVRIMNSGLPITWTPCTDGGPYTNLGKSSFWNASHTDLLAHSSDRVKKFFLYMLERQEDKNYIAYLNAPLNAASAGKEFPKLRALWGAALFSHIAGRKIIQHDTDYFAVPASVKLNAGDVEVHPFSYETVSARFNEKGRVTYGEGPGFHTMLQIRVPQPLVYRKILTRATAHLLHDFDQPSSY